ncbi:hypothetical protein BHE74_00014387 [Ensete ventricosum]|nr:hypothetical protein BHE74_00014387 [Ensete ventricosum]
MAVLSLEKRPFPSPCLVVGIKEEEENIATVDNTGLLLAQHSCSLQQADHSSWRLELDDFHSPTGKAIRR